MTLLKQMIRWNEKHFYYEKPAVQKRQHQASEQDGILGKIPQFRHTDLRFGT